MFVLVEGEGEGEGEGQLCTKCSARCLGRCSLFCAVQKTSAKLTATHTHTKIINATYVAQLPLCATRKSWMRVYVFCSDGRSCGHFHAVANTSWNRSLAL